MFRTISGNCKWLEEENPLGLCFVTASLPSHLFIMKGLDLISSITNLRLGKKFVSI